MNISRDKYLNDLINRMHNGLIKVVTGIRRCGKSYLIFTIFKNYLLEQGIDEKHIVSIELDQRKNRNNNLAVRSQNISQIRNLQQLLSFYQGTPNDLFTELYRYLSKNNPGWLVNFLQNNRSEEHTSELQSDVCSSDLLF